MINLKPFMAKFSLVSTPAKMHTEFLNLIPNLKFDNISEVLLQSVTHSDAALKSI